MVQYGLITQIERASVERVAPLVALLFSLHYALLVPVHLARLAPADGSVVATAATVSSLLFAVLALYWWLGAAATRLSSTVAVIASIPLANNALILWRVPDPEWIGGQALLIAGLGVLSVSARTFWVLLPIAIGVSAIGPLRAGFGLEWSGPALVLFGTSFLALVMRAYRKRKQLALHEAQSESERSRLAAEESLASLVRETEERQRLQEKLARSERLESLGVLAGGVAHDFNNYLAVILGNADLLAEEAALEKNELLLEIRDAALRSADLTRDLLAFSRSQVRHLAVMDLNASVARAERMLGRILGEDIAIEVELAADLGRVRADGGQIEQILVNLAANARAAMPRGGTLRVETENVTLDEETAFDLVGVAPGEFVALSLSDTGAGMSEETQRRIFDPFYTTRSAGTGLGLSTVHGIVEQSGGAIEVSSEVGVGTTFRIFLPRVHEAVEEPAVHVATASPDEGLGSETILIVEDQEMVRRLLARLLSDHGYSVRTAACYDEAVEVATEAKGRIDLLLTDVVMPGADGISLAGELEQRFAIPSLYMSGYLEHGLGRTDELDPEVNFIPKPFTGAELLEAVQRSLAAKRPAG